MKRGKYFPYINHSGLKKGQTNKKKETVKLYYSSGKTVLFLSNYLTVLLYIQSSFLVFIQEIQIPVDQKWANQTDKWKPFLFFQSDLWLVEKCTPPAVKSDCLFLLCRPLSPGGLTSHRALCPTCLKCRPRVVSDVKSRLVFCIIEAFYKSRV